MSAVPAAVQAQYERSKQLEAQGTPAQQASAPAPETPSPAQAPEPTNDWQQRYSSLQGKYNAEVPRLAEELKAQKAQLAEAQRAAAAAAEEARKLREAQASAQADTTLKALEDDYDPDNVVAMLKSLRLENADLHRQLGAITGDVGALKSTHEVRAESVKDALADEVRKAVPNLDAINNDPRFANWVNDVDEQAALYSGQRRTRQDVFDELVATVQPESLHTAVRRAVALYQQWERDMGNVQQPLHSQLSPADTAAASPQPQAGEQWGPKSSRQFYQDRMANKFRGREKEADALDRSLTSAMQEGRWDPRL